MEAGGARRAVVVPNGVDIAAPRVGGSPIAGGPELVFVGLLGYRPNADAVAQLIDRILPLVAREHPDVHLTIVGEGATPAMLAAAGPRVTFTGRVADVRPYVSAASAVVVPLRIGSGTRLKILEAMALARPVVTTSLGAEGLDLVDRQHALIADDPTGFATAVGRVLADPQLAGALGRNGRDLVERCFGWHDIGLGLVDAYRSLLAAR
jgi:glycosyltransferase involved in cell wall biosynthesis